MDQSAIEKYLSGEASEEEIEKLFQWIKSDPKHKEMFYDLKKVWAIRSEMSKNKGVAWRFVEKGIAKRQRRVQFQHILKYAALFVGILGGAYYFLTFTGEGDNLLPATEDAITLETGNGNIEVIKGNGNKTLLDTNGEVVGEQRGDTLNYFLKANQGKISKAKAKNLVFNELNVPYGKKIQVLLADGTLVYLNAGSSLKFPVNFIQGRERKVFLTGEAFFEVAKGKDPFVVSSDNVNVRALGTAFNVSSYPEDESVNTVLVEGSVGVYQSKEHFTLEHSTILKPSHMATWNKVENKISIKKVEVDSYTSWVSGRMVFRNTPFKVIRKKLERHYNIQIINENKLLDEKRYNAVFDEETIEEVMEILDESDNVKYVIENKKLIIK
ncbi:FecR family protein [Arenibacter nanhaiticus]|uniref:FecR family protein n=1 Tax=Arenibacter nanhaiticus TaxID=558155 RepID=A0A1M6FC52_9FLAO|nr:FecR domain-containing protein [Arenibacter nanhaiticus]SHI95233.1 FecR family protein [Arenibacter nanhaiticus]